MIRPKCRTQGHRWVEHIDGYFPPVQFCARLWCKGERVAPWVWLDAPNAAQSIACRIADDLEDAWW